MAKRVDDNQAAIVDALRRAGCNIESLHEVGHGVPDLLVGRHGVNYLLEVKAPCGRLTGKQPEWHATWRGQVAIVRTVDEAFAVMRILQVGD